MRFWSTYRDGLGTVATFCPQPFALSYAVSTFTYTLPNSYVAGIPVMRACNVMNHLFIPTLQLNLKHRFLPKRRTAIGGYPRVAFTTCWVSNFTIEAR